MSKPTAPPEPKPDPKPKAANNKQGLLPELSIRDYKPDQKHLSQIWGPRLDGKSREPA